MNRTVSIETLGCRVNQYESRAMREKLEAAGVAAAPAAEAGAIIINTCTVTAESDRKGRQLIRRCRRVNPGAFIAVTGCMAQRCPKDALDCGADYVTGSRSKMSCADAVLAYFDGKQPGDRLNVTPPDGLPFEKMAISAFERTRAYLKIEDGCDGRCAYCVIKNARGKVVCRDPDDVAREAAAVAASGVHELVLTGIETSAYGAALVPLLARLAEIDGICRLRLGSLDPSFMRPAVVDGLAAIPQVMPHFHLSMQAGSDAVLARMRRRYTREKALEHFAYIREKMPGAMLTTDLMTGFSGETEEEFADTLRLAEEARFLHIHIFPFSRREDTEAWGMPDLPESVKTERAARLAALQKEIKTSILRETAAAAKPLTILAETAEEGGMLLGHSENFIECLVPGTAERRNAFIRAIPAETDGERLICREVTE